MMEIRSVGPDNPDVAALLRIHLAEARESTPLEFSHALASTALAVPDIDFWSVWDGDVLMGFAALKALDTHHGEVKSMRTAASHRGKGVARAVLNHIIGVARERGYTRVSLETGTVPSYAAANALYEAFGFVDGPTFGGYPPSAYNRFMTLMLAD